METTKKRNQVTISISAECAEMLKLIKSSLQIARKKSASYDEIISQLLPEGLKATDIKSYKIFQIATEDTAEEPLENNQAEQEEFNNNIE